MEEALRISITLGIHETLCVTNILNCMGHIHHDALQLELAETLFKSSIDIKLRFVKQSHPCVVDTLCILGFVRYDQMQYPEALHLLEESLRIYEGLYGGREHPKVARCLGCIGNVFRAQCRFEEAAEILGAALDIKERLFGCEHPAVAESWNDLGLLLYDQGLMMR